MVYAMVFITEGFVSLLFEGLWRFNGVLNRGELELMLVRPVSPVLQLLVHDVGMNGIGNVVLGGVMVAQALVHVDVDGSLLRERIVLS